MKLNLFWATRPTWPMNFGDDLSPWLIKRLSPGIDIRWTDPRGGDLSLYLRSRGFLKSKIVPRPDGFDVRHSRKVALLRQPTLLAAGSILSRAVHSSTTVWGSGIIDREDDVLDGRFLVVRGHETRRHLEARGLKPPQAIGDPGLLVPLVYRNRGVVESDVTFIPHVIHYDLVSAAAQSGVRVVDLTGDIATLLDTIASSRMTVSTSLHGVIVSHALGVPALWVSTTDTESRPLDGDNVKFKDYFSSVELEQETAVDLGRIASWTPAKLASLVQSADAVLPHRRIIEARQRDLLAHAPFPLASTLETRLRAKNLGNSWASRSRPYPQTPADCPSRTLAS